MKEAGGLDFVELLEAFDEGLVVPYRLGHSGEGLLEVDGSRRSIVLRWPIAPLEDPKGFAGFKNLSFRTIGDLGDEDRHVELKLDASRHPEATLAFASAIVTQLMGEAGFEKSFRSSIEATRELLQELQVLSDEKALGLMGELLFLKSVVAAHGLELGLKSWMGPPRGEHDFSLPSADFEIKTTRAERRIHRISSATQMEPSLERELYLVSIQLTEVGPVEKSFTLPSLITSVRELLAESSNTFEQHLHEVGWRDWFEEAFTQRFQFRGKPEAYLVDDSFPAITQNRIRDFVKNGQLVESVSYKVDVAGLSPVPGLIEVENIAREA